MWRILALFIFTIFGVSLSGQKATVKVVDASDGQPVPFCHICIEHISPPDKKYYVSNLSGEASFDLHGNEIVSVSAVGYIAYFDTLSSASDEYVIRLESDLFNLEEVVVTGQFKPVSRDQSIYSIDLIGRNDIEYQAANTLAEVLNNKLNISIENDPSTGSSLNLQGISGENIKILVDGVPVIGRLDGNIDLSQINLENVDHIEIVEGPMSVMYGSNALAGVVNIITKRNKHAKFRSGIHGYYESVGTYNLNGNLSFKAGNGTLGLTGGRNFFDGHSLIDSTRTMQWKPKEQYNVGLTYDHRGKWMDIHYKTDYFKERLLDRNEPFPPYYEKANDTWFYTTRYNNNIQFEKDFNNVSNATLLVGYSFYERKKNKYLKDLTTLDATLVTNPEEHDTSTFHAFTGRGIYNHEILEGKLNFNTGFDINTEKGLGKRISNGEEFMGDFALFGSLQYRPFERWTFQPAVRISYNTKYESPVIPSFNIKYSVGIGSLRASYARGFRAPSLKELYLFFYDSNHQIEGNEDLIAERSHHINLNLNCNPEIFHHPFDIKAKAFYNVINDRITLIQVDPDNPLYYRNENIEHFESTGGDFEVGFDILKSLSVYSGIGTIGRKDSYYQTESFDFGLNATANMSLRFFRNTSILSVYYKYTGRNPVYTYITDDEISLNYLEAYHNMDITLLVKLFRQSVHLSTGIKNLFNNTSIAGLDGAGTGHGAGTGSSSLVGWGRTIFVGLKYNFVRY